MAVPLTPTTGATVVKTTTAGELSYDTLFKAADEALLEAKREGRNRVRAARKVPTAPNERTRRFGA
jgi:GGDEF domain-containing protein